MTSSQKIGWRLTKQVDGGLLEKWMTSSQTNRWRRPRQVDDVVPDKWMTSYQTSRWRLPKQTDDVFPDKWMASFKTSGWRLIKQVTDVMQRYMYIDLICLNGYVTWRHSSRFQPTELCRQRVLCVEHSMTLVYRRPLDTVHCTESHVHTLLWSHVEYTCVTSNRKVCGHHDQQLTRAGTLTHSNPPHINTSETT